MHLTGIEQHTIERRLERVEELLERVLHILRHFRPPPPPPTTRLIAVQFKGASSMANNTLVLNVGQTSTASIAPLLADGTTPSGGSLSAVSYSFADPSATVVLNPDGVTATVTGVAASAEPITGTAKATVTDTDGAVSLWNQTFTIQTNAPVPPSQITQSVAVQFTTPA